MTKMLFASLLALAALPLSQAHALQTPVWTCTYQAETPTRDRGADLNILNLLNIQLGPNSQLSHGTMTCASPLFPAWRYEDVTAVSNMIDFGVQLGWQGSGPASSIQIDAGVAAQPSNMFGTFGIQSGLGVDLAVVRLEGDGQVQVGPGEVAGVAKLSAAPAMSLGGDADLFGTVRYIQGSRGYEVK